MLTNEDPGYVDLTSPAGIGIGALVYNYDGDVYASDEGRMLAEMGDQTFRLGNVHDDSYADNHAVGALLQPLEESFTLSAPMCSDCAFEPYCGADPVFHHATAGDFLGRKADIRILPAQHGDLPPLARPLRIEPDRPRDLHALDRPMISLRGRARRVELEQRVGAYRLASERSTDTATVSHDAQAHLCNATDAPPGLCALRWEERGAQASGGSELHRAARRA